jgi:DnaJ-class molecular chaperone
MSIIDVILHDCPTCDGRGEIPVYGRVGEGVLYHKVCPECNGTATQKGSTRVESAKRVDDDVPF